MFPRLVTQIIRDKCFPGGGTHITSDMCCLSRGTHLTRDMCFPGGGTHREEKTIFYLESCTVLCILTLSKYFKIITQIAHF